MSTVEDVAGMEFGVSQVMALRLDENYARIDLLCSVTIRNNVATFTVMDHRGDAVSVQELVLPGRTPTEVPVRESDAEVLHRVGKKHGAMYENAPTLERPVTGW